MDQHGWLGPLCATAPVIREKDGLPATAHVVLDVTERLQRRRLLADVAALTAVLARLATPFLCAIVDHAVDGEGRPTLFTEPFGQSLAADLAERGPLPVADVMAAAEAAGAALTALHGAGRLHHVLSPRALLRAPNHGIRLSCPAVPALAERIATDRDGTGHEPPEVLTSGEWTPAGEVYALASTLWHLLAGVPPTSGTQEERLAKLHGDARPTMIREDVPAHVRSALTSALAVEPAERPADVAELVGLLTGRAGRTERIARPSSRHDTEPPDRPAPVPGRPLGGGYWLDERIGSGGSGVVYRARRLADNAVVAAKLLRPEHVEDRVEVVRFLGERTTVRKLAHPNLVKVHDRLMEGDDVAIVMDFVDGRDLRGLIRSPDLGRTDRLRLLGQVADALAALHDANIVHRDIKPENVLVRGAGARATALLTDFGLAKRLDQPTITHHSQLLGTMAYVSPELVHGRAVTPASDVYSLGVTAYELLAGHRPFADGTPAEQMRAHVEGNIIRPAGLTDAEWDLVSRCLARDPGVRPTARQASTRLRTLATRSADSPSGPFDGDDVLTEPGPTQVVSAPWVAVGPLPLPVQDVPVDESLHTAAASRPVAPPPVAPERRRRPGWPVAGRLTAVVLATAAVGTTIGLLLPHGDGDQDAGRGTEQSTGQDVEPTTRTTGVASPPIYPIPVNTNVEADGQVVLQWSAEAEELPGFQRYAVFRDGQPLDEPPAGTVRYLDPAPGDDPCYVVVAVGVTAEPPSPLPPQQCPKR